MIRTGPEVALPVSATPEETAAIAAAIERFLHDHTPLPYHGLTHGPDPWTRAARLEAVARDAPAGRHPWINT